jgi:hypothetical protein
MSHPKRDAFRAEIGKRLALMGYSRAVYYWQDEPARLVVMVGAERGIYHINATVGHKTVEAELARLARKQTKTKRQIRQIRALNGYAAGETYDLEDILADRGH